MPQDADAEEVLVLKASPMVVRVGQTVRRAARPSASTIQAFLAHLHARGFHDAPDF